jgi:hypothetical protein
VARARLEPSILERILLALDHGLTMTRRENANVRSDADSETALAKQHAICRAILWACPDVDPALIERVGLVHHHGRTMSRKEVANVRQGLFEDRTVEIPGDSGQKDRDSRHLRPAARYFIIRFTPAPLRAPEEMRSATMACRTEHEFLFHGFSGCTTENVVPLRRHDHVTPR